MSKDIFCGAIFQPTYPFIRDKYQPLPEGEGKDWPNEAPTWRPGVEHECTDNMGSTRSYADSMGHVQFQVISVHKPGGFSERVFYVRQWIDPDGKVFGKKNLRVTTSQAFKRLINGYRHEFEMADE